MSSKSTLKVVLIGTFHKDKHKLNELFKVLSDNYNMLSPSSITFVDESGGFSRSKQELGQSIVEIEKRHLAAIESCDIAVLFNPEGYIGISSAFELGFAYAHNIPIVTIETPTDPTIASLFTNVKPFT